MKHADCLLLMAALAAGRALSALPSLTVPDMLSGHYDYRRTNFVGTVTDVLDDETDLYHVFLTVRQNGQDVLVPVNYAKQSYRDLRKLIGAEVAFRGKCDPTVQRAMRRHMGRRFDVDSPGDLRVIRPAPDLFAAPDLLALDLARPSEIAAAGRHQTCGRVLATWGSDQLLLRTASNRLTRVRLAGSRLPACGDTVQIVGFPETDLYHLNLTCAVWRRADADIPKDGAVCDTTVRALLEVPSGIGKQGERVYGKTLRIRGKVMGMPRGGVMLVGDAGHVMSVDVSAVGPMPDGLLPDCTLEVTGTCVMDVGNWQPHDQFPKISKITLVARTPEDIRVVAAPPWWTVGRMAAVVGGLLVVISGILLWNRMLRALAERRGRELYREQVATARSELKVVERTNLAVELHDAISQYLTGIALELRAADESSDRTPEPVRQHLRVASSTLASCRDELRNCLWDLRNNALEERSMDAAIRQTLAPHLGGAQLIVRFNVPRTRFTDNSAHAVLHILRELATNAVRHGNASEIRIAGAAEDGVLKFSVRDNGCGFDPENCPGMEDGHFGLLGVSERAERLNGEFKIESGPQGTKAVVTFPLEDSEA